MKIMYVYDAIARVGGAERILVDKMNYLADVYGYDVYLITAAQGNHPFSFPLSSKVKHTDINARFHVQYQYKYLKRLWMKLKLDRLFRQRLSRAVAQIDPDILIGTTYYKADVICRLKCRAKKIIESHCAKTYTGQNDGIKRNFLVQWFYNIQLARYNRTIEKESDAIVALTEGDAGEWHKKGKVFVIPNMVRQIPETKASCEVHRVISAGRLIYQKGYDRLIDAWKYVYEKHPDWKLSIFGKGILQEKLSEQIIKYKLEKAIELCPPTPEIMKEFSSSSIYVMSSNYEGFPMILLEAMACGLPCISFNCPFGPSDIISQQKDGIIVENNNIKHLSDAICSLIENGPLRRQFGAEAGRNAKRYTPQNIMPQWKQLFQEL